MDHGDGAGLVRMGVGLGRAAMRGPARMADADMALERGLIEEFAQIIEFADGAADFKMATRVERGNAGGVVTAVFEPAQSTEQDRGDLARADIADYSTHERFILP